MKTSAGIPSIPGDDLGFIRSRAVRTNACDAGLRRRGAAWEKERGRGRDLRYSIHCATVCVPGRMMDCQCSWRAHAICSGWFSSCPCLFLSVARRRFACNSRVSLAISCFRCCLLCGLVGSSRRTDFREFKTLSPLRSIASRSARDMSIPYACAVDDGVSPLDFRNSRASAEVKSFEQSMRSAWTSWSPVGLWDLSNDRATCFMAEHASSHHPSPGTCIAWRRRESVSLAASSVRKVVGSLGLGRRLCDAGGERTAITAL
mmetsp:Transcript_67334/g.112770  ORF Transcript_67334/g.112770 Transcript_67334/m.112770 type:complete len:260 (+) Transcript_67334:3006-3785(+)